MSVIYGSVRWCNCCGHSDGKDVTGECNLREGVTGECERV